MRTTDDDHPDGGGGAAFWLGAARLAALLTLVSSAGVVALIAIGVIGLVDRPDRSPPFGWITTVSCGSALVSLVVAVLVLVSRRTGPAVVHLGRRACVAAPIAFLVSCFAYFLLVAFVYGQD